MEKLNEDVAKIKLQIEKDIQALLNLYPLKKDRDQIVDNALSKENTGLVVKHQKVKNFHTLLSKNHYYKSTIDTPNSHLTIHYHYNFTTHLGTVNHETHEQGVVFEGVCYIQRQLDEVIIDCENHKINLSHKWLATKMNKHHQWLDKLLHHEEEELNNCILKNNFLNNWDKPQYQETLNSASKTTLMSLILKCETKAQYQTIYGLMQKLDENYTLNMLIEDLDLFYEKTLKSMVSKAFNDTAWAEKKKIIIQALK